MKNLSSKQITKGLILTAVVMFLFAINADAQTGGTAAAVSNIYKWLKPVVNGVLLIITLIFAARCLFKIAFKHEQATMDIAMFLVFFVFWGAWAIFANDIISLVGGTTQAF